MSVAVSRATQQCHIDTPCCRLMWALMHKEKEGCICQSTQRPLHHSSSSLHALIIPCHTRHMWFKSNLSEIIIFFLQATLAWSQFRHLVAKLVVFGGVFFFSYWGFEVQAEWLKQVDQKFQLPLNPPQPGVHHHYFHYICQQQHTATVNWCPFPKFILFNKID